MPTAGSACRASSAGCAIPQYNVTKSDWRSAFVIDNDLHSARSKVPFLRLHDLPLRRPADVESVDWDALSPAEGQRLREFGLYEGVRIEALHHSGFLGRGPIACRIGRMTIAMRRNHAAAISVRLPDEQGGEAAAA